jgi:hypothetical protein
MIHRIARNRGADRSADADGAADDTEREVEPSGAAGDVGDHERKHHTEDSCRNAIEYLHSDDEIWAVHERKKHRAGRQGRKAKQQQRPSPP